MGKRNKHEGNVELRVQADRILRSLEADVDLIPSNIADWWKTYLHRHFNRYLDTLSFLDSPDMKRRILEIGSVPGHFTVLLKKLGFDVVGVDIDPTRVSQIWQKYDLSVEIADIERKPLPFSSDSFDIVLFAEILEHLRLNPLFALREVHRVLKSRGRIILSTPNITPLHRLLFLIGRSYQGDPLEEFKKLEWLGHMGHIRFYSLEEARGFLEYVGFGAISQEFKGKVPGGKLGRFLMLLSPKRDRFRNYLYLTGTKL